MGCSTAFHENLRLRFFAKRFIHARMFAPLDNIPEDPATGSACAALVAFLCDLEKQPLALTVHQGEDMGRPSLIHLTADSERVTVEGQAVRVMEGHLLEA
ncbi:MAG TPA: PhzF family phenazine biosynthesis protein [Roseovarius sp.]|nr:PhzF family phenazine biosynthesis protein [Roseovarius sp.]